MYCTIIHSKSILTITNLSRTIQTHIIAYPKQNVTCAPRYSPLHRTMIFEGGLYMYVGNRIFQAHFHTYNAFFGTNAIHNVEFE